jgi:hypothetical protein
MFLALYFHFLVYLLSHLLICEMLNMKQIALSNFLSYPEHFYDLLLHHGVN